ncbi:excreted virulence factor EspC (type VII ESX diderm) [Tamaricihabitans halophyticus]|uniref:Excreted virulence factor EspC (Type VII ESX diderm) n=1 Tax=Tamaricihabitans halophyticus TaxID=1262583 RepID=A0A4R2QVK7_9PSEU|nr:hypothetical protein [Tamaricihabitans halophyticus]TCP53119.1 excreted virulence factor EspC (type VII ESX diderm) [Tamaricihabitans halophyticus]
MTGYAVHIQELGKLITGLENASEEITAANKTLAAQSTLGLLGNETLATAGEEFEETWEYGIEQLGEAAEGVTERLAEAKRNYQELEETNEAIFSGNGDTGSPPLITDSNSQGLPSGSGQPTGQPGAVPGTEVAGQQGPTGDRSLEDTGFAPRSIADRLGGGQ